MRVRVGGREGQCEVRVRITSVAALLAARASEAGGATLATGDTDCAGDGVNVGVNAV